MSHWPPSGWGLEQNTKYLIRQSWRGLLAQWEFSELIKVVNNTKGKNPKSNMQDMSRSDTSFHAEGLNHYFKYHEAKHPIAHTKLFQENAPSRHKQQWIHFPQHVYKPPWTTVVGRNELLQPQSGNEHYNYATVALLHEMCWLHFCLVSNRGSTTCRSCYNNLQCRCPFLTHDSDHKDSVLNSSHSTFRNIW